MKDIVSLRNHLFDALNRIADATEDQIEIEINKAAAIVQVSETIIKTAEVENQFIAITKGFGSGFIPVISDKKSLVEIIKKQVDAGEKPKEVFDVNAEKNWLANDNGRASELDDHDMPAGGFGKLDD